MSAIKVETTEPDPAATSISNDETVNKAGGDPAAPTDKEAVKAEAELETTDVKAEEVKDEKNGSPDSKYKSSTYEKRKFQRRNNNSKFDPSVMPTTDDPVKIRAQVEFYFGDANLPTDKFMWEMTDGESNLPVKISKIHSFKRMQVFQPYSAVVAALKDSEFLKVTGPEGLEEVSRKSPYDPKAKIGHRAESRSIYAKGFGDEEPTTQFDIEAFFAPYGPTNSVRLRRTDDKLFKGSVFVEFADDALAEKFLALDPKPLWKGKHELKITSKKEYVTTKEQEIKDGKIQPNSSRPPFRGGRDTRGRGNFRGRDRDGQRGSRGDRDPDDWKKRRDDDQKSGFKDNHRNGRGRGRGGRGKDDRRNNRNEEREEKYGDKTTESEPSDKKRPREEESTSEAPAAKKVDSKPEVATEAS